MLMIVRNVWRDIFTITKNVICVWMTVQNVLTIQTASGADRDTTLETRLCNPRHAGHARKDVCNAKTVVLVICASRVNTTIRG